MITFLVSLFYAGTFLLICAIAVNAVIKYFNIMNWYELLNHLKNRKWPKNIKFIDIIWLFFWVPIDFGFCGLFSTKIFPLT